MQLDDIFSEKQIKTICNIIIRQCQRHQQRELYYQDLCYEPYAGNRGEHSLTLSVLSGFRNNTVIEGISVSIEKYGLNDKMGQPVLSSNSVIAHIYNSGCGFSSQPFKDYCQQYNADLSVMPIYVCIVFRATKDGVLKNISIKVPDSTGMFSQDYNFPIYNYSSVNAEIA